MHGMHIHCFINSSAFSRHSHPLCMNWRILDTTVTLWRKVKKMQSTNHQFRIIARTASSHCYLSITSKLTTEYHLDWFPNVRPQRVIKLILGCINTCIRTSNYSKQCTTNPWDHKFLLLSRNHTSSDIDKLLRTKILAEYQTFKVVSQENKT